MRGMCKFLGSFPWLKVSVRRKIRKRKGKISSSGGGGGCCCSCDSGGGKIILVPSSLHEEPKALPPRTKSKTDFRRLQVCDRMAIVKEADRNVSPPPDAVRICVGIKYHSFDSHKSTFLVEIPCAELHEFLENRLTENPTNGRFYYVPHQFYHSDKKPSSSIRCFDVSDDASPFYHLSTSGSTLYAVHLGKRKKLLSFNFNFDLDKEDPAYRRPRLVSHHYTFPLPGYLHEWLFDPKLAFTLCGRLYVFEDVGDPSIPFGAVFDPETREWSKLKPPPGWMQNNDCWTFVISLGESEGKILFYPFANTVSPVRNTPRIYDLRSNKWSEYPLPQLDAWDLRAQPVVVEDHLYWLSSKTGMLYAFNWKLKRGWHGMIVGLDHEDILLDVHNQRREVCMVHIWADIFCLIWCSSGKGDTTCFHFTFIRVFINSGDSLSAFVVGCHSHPILDLSDEDFTILGSFHV